MRTFCSFGGGIIGRGRKLVFLSGCRNWRGSGCVTVGKLCTFRMMSSRRLQLYRQGHQSDIYTYEAN